MANTSTVSHIQICDLTEHRMCNHVIVCFNGSLAEQQNRSQLKS